MILLLFKIIIFFCRYHPALKFARFLKILKLCGRICFLLCLVHTYGTVLFKLQKNVKSVCLGKQYTLYFERMPSPSKYLDEMCFLFLKSYFFSLHKQKSPYTRPLLWNNLVRGVTELLLNITLECKVNKTQEKCHLTPLVRSM